MSATSTSRPSAVWLGDPHDYPEEGVWLRADDGMTRGQAQATWLDTELASAG